MHRGFAHRSAVAGVVLVALNWATPLAHAAIDAWMAEQIGYTRLTLELGGATPTGAGVIVTQVEADSGGYRPDTSDATHFGGKTFNLMSGASGISGHANDVAYNYYSNSTSIAPGISTINLWDANDYLNNFLNRTQTGVAPDAENARVQNHSWIGSYGSVEIDAAVLRRLDYAVNASDFVAVVGTNNGNSTVLPSMLVHAYNVIVVGRSDGDHAAGYTTYDTAGRIKPDIVAPRSATSYATPVVGAAAALMIQTATTNGYVNGGKNEVVKAVLLAGATKKEFALWDRTITRPLDDRYGAGELNVYRSYKILTADQQEAGNTTVAKTGWDFNTTTTGSTRKYFFDLTQIEEETSILLTWNRLVDDPNVIGFDTAAFVPNLDLKLSTATGSVVGTMLDQSISTLDNIEHIYLQNLAIGRYVIEVSSATAGIEYAVAWTSVPEPGALALLVFVMPLLARRKRKSVHNIASL